MFIANVVNKSCFCGGTDGRLRHAFCLANYPLHQNLAQTTSGVVDPRRLMSTAKRLTIACFNVYHLGTVYRFDSI